VDKKINYSALDEWLNAEFEKQTWNAEHAMGAYDLVKMVESGEITVFDSEEYEKIERLCNELNAATCAPAEKRVSADDFGVSADRVRKARELIDGLDNIERAAYDRDSMALISSTAFGRFTGADMSICYAVVSHFWGMFGTVSYNTWPFAFRSYRIKALDFKLGGLKEAIRDHIEIVLKSDLPAEDAVFHTHIVPPARFYEN
jgi:hypothetical protein